MLLVWKTSNYVIDFLLI